MGFLKIGETDRDGRQKRIEHTGRYLRASRTGGVSLRAQARVGGVNATVNTSHGVRVSTRLAKNTQVGFQNGRFVLRGRYGSDAAKLNLSKSGVSVSTKTPAGTINWMRPGSSSFKAAGIQVRGRKALWLQAIYGVIMVTVAALEAAVRLVILLVQVVAWAAGGISGAVARRRAAARLEEEEQARPGFPVEEAAAAGERLVSAQGIELDREPARDLLAALTFLVVSQGRGQARFDPEAAGLSESADAASRALAVDARVAGEQIVRWLGEGPEEESPLAVAGLVYVLARAYGRRLDAEARGEVLFALDDACLAGGPKTLLQEEMIDLLVSALEVEVVLAGEA